MAVRREQGVSRPHGVHTDHRVHRVRESRAVPGRTADPRELPQHSPLTEGAAALLIPALIDAPRCCLAATFADGAVAAPGITGG